MRDTRDAAGVDELGVAIRTDGDLKVLQGRAIVSEGDGEGAGDVREVNESECAKPSHLCEHEGNGTEVSDARGDVSSRIF